MRDSLSLRKVVVCCAATVISYVGLAHEFVGAKLYPEGPAELGGALIWHGIGLSTVAVGMLIGACALGLTRIPAIALGVAVALLGLIFFVDEAVQHGGFHFFALTLALAGATVVAAARGKAKERF
jgi:hypothetical protein